MIPKIIHTIWIEGYHLLPEEVQKKHLLVKKQNPEWEFKIWDNNSIQNLLKKHSELLTLYKKISNSLSTSPFLSEKEKTEESNLTQIFLAQYIILKEYGGVYCDIHLKCLFDFNTLFTLDSNEKEEIYLVKSSHWLSDKLYYLYPFFDRNNIDNQLMAFSKDHPIWDIVIKKLVALRNSEQIKSIFDHIVLCHTEYSVHYLKQEGDCFIPTEFSVLDKFTWLKPYFSVFHCNYKQIYLVIILIISVIFIHNISVFNGHMFPFPSAVPIPGIPSNTTPSSLHLEKPLNKPKSKKRSSG